MNHSILFVGLDVHKATLSVAVAESSRDGEVRCHGSIPNRPEHIRKLADRLGAGGRRLHFCYEAGPCGYGLYRQLCVLGHECIVVAPSLIPTRAGDRVKTDRRDAAMLAGINIVLKALEAPIRQIAENSGVEGSIVVGRINDNKSDTFGFDAQTEQYVDMLQAGIVDPAKVVRTALQNAASVAGLLITTEAMVAEAPKKESARQCRAAGAWAAWAAWTTRPHRLSIDTMKGGLQSRPSAC